MIEFPLIQWMIWSWQNLNLYFKYKNISIGAKSRIKNTVFEGQNRVGSNVYLYNSKIGAHTYISDTSTIQNAVIGKFCSIAEQVQIASGNHPTSFLSSHPVFYSDKKQNGTTFSNKTIFDETPMTYIGNDVWIGAKAVLMNGIKIGNGAVIAAGAIVNTDVPAYAIVGGVPAKILKFRFTPDIIETIEAQEWWSKSESELKKNISFFQKDIYFQKDIEDLFK